MKKRTVFVLSILLIFTTLPLWAGGKQEEVPKAPPPRRLNQ